MVALCLLGALGSSFFVGRKQGWGTENDVIFSEKNIDTVFSVKNSFSDKKAFFIIPIKCQSSPYPLHLIRFGCIRRGTIGSCRDRGSACGRLLCIAGLLRSFRMLLCWCSVWFCEDCARGWLIVLKEVR